MNNILTQVSALYEQELYSNVVHLFELAITVCEQKQDFTPYMKFQLYVNYADSLYNLQNYLEAESAYMQTLQIRKYIVKAKNSIKITDTHKDIVSDIDLKYKLHICCIKMKQPQNAIDVLQSIAARTRTPKINMALGNLYKEAGLERSAVTCYKEVLRESPLAIEASENLLKLGVNVSVAHFFQFKQGAEVNSMMLESTSDLPWINTWLRAQAQVYSRDYSNAMKTFKSLDSFGLLKNNSQLCLNTAYCYNYMCDEIKAILYLRRAFRTQPNLKTGKDLLASLLARTGDKENMRELEKMARFEKEELLWTCEEWIIMGYVMVTLKKYDRAAFFGQQACIISHKSIEGLLLKAAAFVQMGKYQEAILHCREVLEYTTARFDVYKFLVESYIATNRTREAVSMAANACKQLNSSPQALTLYASVLMKDPMSTCKVRSYLDRALAVYSTYSPAVYLLAEHLEQENRADEACAILKRHVEVVPSSKSHQLLADCLVRLQKDEEASDHYNSALRLDPDNQKAAEGLNNLGRSPSASKLDSSYYVSAGGDSSTFNSQGQSQSDHEQDQESDTDPWPPNSVFMPYE